MIVGLIVKWFVHDCINVYTVDNNYCLNLILYFRFTAKELILLSTLCW